MAVTLRHDQRTGVQSLQHDDRLQLLDEFLIRLQRLNRTPATLTTYRILVENLLEVYPNVTPHLLTSEHIERALWDRGLSPRSFETAVRSLRSFFEFLRLKKGLVEKNPCDGVDLPKWRPRLRPAPSIKDFEAIRSVCHTLEEVLLVEMLYFTGLRVAELRSLYGRDIDLDVRRLKVMGKGQKERLVPFPLHVAELIRQWKSEHADPDRPFLYRETPGMPGVMSDKWINRTLKRLGRACDLPYPLTAHVMRHGWFRLMKTSGMPLEFAARLGGHENIQTTARIYGQLSIDDMQKAYDERLDVHPGVIRNLLRTVPSVKPSVGLDPRQDLSIRELIELAVTQGMEGSVDGP